MGAQEDHDGLQALAERMGLEDSERDNFIGSAMKRLGHTMRQMWEDSTDDDNSGGDFFSRSSGGGRKREVPNPRGKGSGDDKRGPWGY